MNNCLFKITLEFDWGYDGKKAPWDNRVQIGVPLFIAKLFKKPVKN